jgi:polyisoprenoid-binding protein YceI
MSQSIAAAVSRLVSAFALTAAAASGSAALAADVYVFDKANTEIRFSWSPLGIGSMSGVILDYDGKLVFDKAAPEKSKLEFIAKTDSLSTGIGALTDYLKTPEFFHAAKFPKITFKATRIETTGKKTGKITGDLTIKGVTRPVTLDAELNFGNADPALKKPALGFRARGTVNRSEFNLGMGVPLAPEEIRITIETKMRQG